MASSRIAVSGLLLLLATGPAAVAQDEEASTPALDRRVVAAAGIQSAQLTVPRFGRYSLRVASDQGTALQLVDRMAGPGSTDGVAGERDGRLDLFLERGEYRLVSQGHQNARGEAQLEALAFAPVSTERPPRLVELKLVSGALRDLEQSSWWLEVDERREVNLEAAGRSLADLRLWKDGQWLVDAAPQISIVQPRQGQPLLVCRLATTLEPGLYLVTAYGGPSQPWSEQSDEHPLYLRAGIPQLGTAGRQRYEVSPFGVDRYRVPGATTYFRIELPEARPAELTIAPFDPKQPFFARGERLEIDKRTLPPVAEARLGPLKNGPLKNGALGNQERVLVVTADAAQPYVLQHFELRDAYRFRGENEHWVSTIHSGHAADSVDATGILIESRGRERTVSPYREQTIVLGGNRAWRRRINLLAPLTLYLNIRETGSYTFASEGVAARFRPEPFLISRPRGYEPPDFRPGGAVWELDAGYYVLTAEPVRAGIVTLTLRPHGIVDSLLDIVGLDSRVETGPVTASVRFPEVFLKENRDYRLFLNQQPGVTAGVVVRRLPLDLGDPLPLWQKPGEEVTVPFAQAEPGSLRAKGEDGTDLEVSVDGGPWQTRAAVSPGRHAARVRVDGTETRVYSLVFEPARLDPDAPLPPVPDALLAGLPDFPSLEAGKPRHFDLPQSATNTLLVRADRSGLYRLQSTGLLATTGNLRTRTVTSLVRRSQNGVGRNFLIQNYLREGDYQLTVAAEGRSAGHLGVSLEKASLQQGGFLTLYRPARTSLAAGAAVEYRFIITEPGRFRVRAIGQGRPLRCRLEDRSGWPVVTPNVAADVARWFDPGHYRFIVLPEATDARVISLIEPVPQPRRYSGRGPHRLPLARAANAVWYEPEAGAPREPAVWTFEAPAEMDVRVELTGEMRASLVDASTDRKVAEIPALRGYQGRLAKGRYRLEVSSSRINSAAPYRLAVWPQPLVAGLDRSLTLPAEVPVAVGASGLVELFSFGSQDVRARLYDEAGRVVASNDDRADDWNFHIGLALEAGEYLLRVDPVGAAQGATRISMRTPEVLEEAALAPPAVAEVVLGDAARLYPLALPPGDALLLASARAREGVGLALERQDGEGWRNLALASGREARLEVPVSGPTEPTEPTDLGRPRYRLRLWSLDRRDSPVALNVAAVSAGRASESRLASGLTPVAVAGFVPQRAVAAVALKRPGVFAVEPRPDLRWCTTIDTACEAGGDVVAATGRVLWVVSERADAGVRARRVELAMDDGSPPVPVGRDPVRVDLKAPRGVPVLVRARSRAGQPGIRIGSGTEDAKPSGVAAKPSGVVMDVGEGSAVAVALGARRGAALVWQATPSGAPIETRLELVAFDEPERSRLTGGQAAAPLAAGSARRLDLGPGPKLLRLALDAGLVAVLADGDRVASVHWASAGPLAESVVTEAGRLLLLHAGSGEGRYAVERIPLADGARNSLASGAPFEARLDRAGQLRLTVAPARTGATLRVRGAQGDAVLITSCGRVRRGADLPLEPREGGSLVVPHAPGLLFAWRDEGGGGSGPWPAEAAIEPTDLEPPASLALSGSARALRVRLPEPAVLHLRTSDPVVTRLQRAGGADQVDVHSEGARVDAYLPEGRATLTLRGVGGPLSGSAELTASPVTAIAEGLGPEVLLAPGATRFFSFRVAESGPVGIGVRASADVVSATLLSTDGHVLAEGTAQMTTLEAGSYLLALGAPRAASPVRARPAVLGLEPPGTGPPEEVVRQYLQRFRLSDEPEGGE